MITIQDPTLTAADVLLFKGMKFNCSQTEEGTAEIEFIDESEGTELTQSIFNTWKSEYDSRPDDSYKIARAISYPSITDQLDMLYHDIKAGTLETGDWITAIETIKTDNPKPE